MILLGSFVTACAIDLVLVPNQLVDGGVIGVSMAIEKLYQTYHMSNGKILSYLVATLTIPFLVLAYKSIGKRFVVRMAVAVLCFAVSSHFLHLLPNTYRFVSEGQIEAIALSGLVLGVGVGIVIKYGACIDGTEIMAILLNRRYGFTVGQVILALNVFIFSFAGYAYGNYGVAIRSLIAYFVAYKVIDAVIAGFDEMKSVTIFSNNSKNVVDSIVHELGVGVTVMRGKGGYSKNEKDIIYVIIERLQLVELKTIVHREDPNAFMAIENIHELVHPHQAQHG